MNTAVADRTEDNLEAGLAHTTAEISRTDSKAGLLLTLDGLLVTGLSLLGTDVRGLSLILALIGATALVISVVLALVVVRPRLGIKTGKNRASSDHSSFVYWAIARPDEIMSGLQEDRRVQRLKVLSVLVLRKMRILALSGDAALVAVVAIGAAIVTR